MQELDLQQTMKGWHGTLKAYLIGFFGSIILTLISFSFVVFHVLTGSALVYTIIGLALLQAIVQLLFFLHLREGKKPHWEITIFYFMVTILLIVVVGSLWIMHDLNKRMMPNMEMTQ